MHLNIANLEYIITCVSMSKAKEVFLSNSNFTKTWSVKYNND